jgi:hypothetical protein
MNIKKCLIATVILIFNNVAFAQANAFTQTSLPLQFNTGNPAPHGMPSTTIVIQGKKIPIILDTGAMKSELILSKHALKNIDVKYTGRKICFVAMDGKRCEKEFVISEVNIGSFVVKNVKGTLMSQLWDTKNKNFKVTEASKNGVIGLGFLSKFNLLLDYPNSKALLIKPNEKPASYDVANWVTIPFRGSLLTRLELNGRPMTFGWDTGAVPSIIKASAVKNFKPTPCPTNAHYAAGIETISLLTSGGKKLPNAWFHLRDIPPYAPFDALFGSNFFKENLVYFDFDKHLIYVNRASSDAAKQTI